MSEYDSNLFSLQTPSLLKQISIFFCLVQLKFKCLQFLIVKLQMIYGFHHLQYILLLKEFLKMGQIFVHKKIN